MKSLRSLDAAATNPYQKPLPLYMELLRRFTKPNDFVVEVTGGSGSLVAACGLRYADRHGTLPAWRSLSRASAHIAPSAVVLSVDSMP